MQHNFCLDYNLILKHWDISFQKSHPELVISGSPQRSSYRIVIEDNNQKKFILEKIPTAKFKHKQLICKTLAHLSDQRISSIYSYIKNKDDTFLTEINGSYWQLIPYISGISLERPGYVFDKWRGIQSATFLIELWENTIEISRVIHLPCFSLKDYVLKLIDEMKTFNPEEYKRVEPILLFLKTDFFTQYDRIPSRFCHGDYHPLNIIWGINSIQAVIDWEFLGLKIETYDMANLLGCIGIEEPTSLINEYALSFIQRIKDSMLISDIGFSFLFECMISLRFGWLAEWLRTQDREMIDLELDYLFFLLQQKDQIKKEWNLA
jgi:homoserine kinase type II